MYVLSGAPALPTFQFDVFQGHPVRAVVSTRKGGVSPAPWDSLNFSVMRGDDPRNVGTNLCRFVQACGFDRDDIVLARQIRENHIQAVTDRHRGQRVPGVDGLTTAVPELPLMTLYADCVPVVAYDTARHVLGVCHAGWQGTTLQIARNLIQCLSQTYGTDPADCLCGIGPSIGPDSYEVGPDVIARVCSELPTAERLLRPAAKREHAYLDLWQANLDQLVMAGVPVTQIEVSGMDTAQMTDVFFSHRAEKGRCGLFGLLCWLQAL